MTSIDLKRARKLADDLETGDMMPDESHEAASLIRSLCEIVEKLPVTADGVPTVLWGGNHFASRLPDSGGWLVWDKERPALLDQSTCELAWTNCVKGVRVFRHLWNGMMRASEHGECFHPTQKPVDLFRWIFSLPWIPAGTVFDPYMGSGPCGVAALDSGRSYIGCEIESRYFDIARRRIEAAASVIQQPLFGDTQGEKGGA